MVVIVLVTIAGALGAVVGETVAGQNVVVVVTVSVVVIP